jgi:hypothetical protein
MPVDVYNGDNQLDFLKSILDTNTVKNDLDVPLTIKEPDGTDTGTPNDFGVMIQSPYFVMPNYLPQLFVEMQYETPTDENFNNAEVTTGYRVYYAMVRGENEPTMQRDMYTSLKYLARYLVANYRTCQPYWYTLTLPTIEPTNEVDRWFAEQTPRVLIAVGRISFDVKDKRAYR